MKSLDPYYFFSSFGFNGPCHFGIISDVHGKDKDYKKQIEKAKTTVQIGDFTYNLKEYERTVNTDLHKFLPGNHDRYRVIVREDLTEKDITPYTPYVFRDGYVYEFVEMPTGFIGNYGVWQIPETQYNLFFIRGAWSIDKSGRTEFINWWKDEELTQKDGRKAIELYSETKPDLVISHTCPFSITKNESSPTDRPKKTITGQILDAIFEIHQPKIWVFGHFHQRWHNKIGNTDFYCLHELDMLGFDKNMNCIGVEEP